MLVQVRAIFIARDAATSQAEFDLGIRAACARFRELKP
jgi:hypothetical protein